MLKRIMKRSLSLLMVILMVAAIIPQIAWAAELDTGITGLSASYNNGTWIRSGAAITGSVKTTSSSGCGSTDYTAAEGTLTLKNSSGSNATLSFTVTAETNGGLIRINGEDAGSKDYSFALAANDTVSIYIKSSETEEKTTRVVLSNMQLISERDVNITFIPSENGSYTVDGAAIDSDKTITKKSTESFALSATPDSGYAFAGWIVNNDPSNVISSEASASLAFTEDKTVTAYFVDDSVAVFDVSGKQFYTLNSAVSYAQSNSKSKITLVSDGTLPAGSYSIPSGITLLIPFDDAQTIYTSAPAIVYGSHTMPTAFRTLTMAPGASITVQKGGAICLGGKLSSSGQLGGWNGTPTGPDGRINMLGGSSITLESGANLYCWGYIYGDGSVEAKSGSTVYEAFQIKDWRGGTATSNVYKYAFIFSQYYIQNIEVPLKVNAGATEKLYSAVNASGSAYPMSATFIGSGGMFALSSGYILKDYQESTDRLHVEVSGNVSLSPMTLSGIPMIGSITTGEYVLPINGNLSIDILSGTTTVTQDVEFLPGVETRVARDAALQISSGKKVYLYDESDWQNFTGNARLYPIGYSVANGTTTVRTAADLKDALIDVNGTLTVAGSLFTSSGGANITSTLGTENGKGMIAFSTAPAVSATLYEMLGNSDKTAVSFTAPKLHNGSGSYSSVAGTGTSTWYYDKDGEHWYRYLVSFVYNEKTIATGYYCENNDTVIYDAGWLTGLGASVTSGSATAAVSGSHISVTNVTSNATVTLTGTAAQFIPTFVLNEKQYQNYKTFTGADLTETRTINDQTYYVVKRSDAAMSVGTAYAAPTDAEMGVSADKHNSIVWNLSGLSATSGNSYAGFVPVGETGGGDAYIFGFYTGAVAYNSFTDRYYATLAEAMADVPQSGTGTVRLIADCGTYEEESGTAAYPIGTATNLTLDLNGHKAVGRLVNKGTMTLELGGGTWDYRTGATAAAAAYQGMAAVINSGSATIRDSVGGGKITADAISNAGVPNHSSVVRNLAGGTLDITDVTLESMQDVNSYVSVIMNYQGTISGLHNITVTSPRGYAVWNQGGHISVIDSCTVDCAYGIYNRNIRGNAITASGGATIAANGTIDLIRDSTVTAGQYAVNNGGVIGALNNCTFTAHPDSAQVNTYGTTASNAHGNVQCYTVYNNNAWWYDTAVWKRTDSDLTRTDEYKEDASCRPTIGTIVDCRIYAENTGTSADHGYALYNSGIIDTISGSTEIKTYKHPDNAKSIASNYALRNTSGGIIRSLTGTVNISAAGCSAVYNDGQFTAKTVNTYGDKIGGVQLHNTTTYGAPSTIEAINAAGTISAGSYYGIYTNGKIGSIGGGLTISANYNALLNSGAGALRSYDYMRSYGSNTDASTETKRLETYVRNLTDGGVIGSIDGVHFVGTGNNSYQLLQNQGYIGTLANSDFTAATPRAGESYPMLLNGDGRQSGHTLLREPYAYESLFITPYEYHYDYDVAVIDVIDHVTLAKSGTFAFRNLGRINTLSNSAISGTQYVLVNAASGSYVSRDSIRYYSGATKFATTKSASELTYAYERIPAEIRRLDNNTIQGTSTYTLYNGGHLGTLTGNTVSSTGTTVLYNGGATVRSYDYNLKDIITVTATESACTVAYGVNDETRVITTDYDAPVIDKIGAGNKLSGTYQVLVNLGTITSIDGGEEPVTITATTQKQVGGIYNQTGTLDRRVATTPYTSGTAGTVANADTYLNAHIGSIKNTLINSNGIGIQNGSANANYRPVIDELGEGLEVNANCTTAGYHAVYNTTYARIAAITGGIYTAAKATTNAYKNNNADPEHATLISGGDFKGAAATRANAVFEPDNTNRQTYPDGKTLVGTRGVTRYDGTTADGYFFVGTTYTVTFVSNGGSSIDPQTVPQGQTAEKPDDPTKDGCSFAGWYTDEALTEEYDFRTPVTGDLTLYAKWDEAAITYDVRFFDEDGASQIGESQTIQSGEKPVAPADPAKAATAQYTYAFVGWKVRGDDTVYPADQLPAINGDTDFVAVYSRTLRYYTVTWKNWDGTELLSGEVAYGETPVYTGETPARGSTAQYSYTFDRWAPEIAPVTGNATYTAMYIATVNTYTVTWVNEDGTVLEKDEDVPYGSIPSFDGVTPVKLGDEQYSYIFDKWMPAIAEVTGDVTYTATFTEATNTYTVIWNNYDGTELEKDEAVPYGATPSYDGAMPVKAADARFTYTFIGWTPEITPVTGNITYTATFSETLNTYTVTWVNEDGTVLEKDEEVPYGTIPTYNGETPTKTADAHLVYTFDQWTPVVAAVTGDITYTAVYISAPRIYNGPEWSWDGYHSATATFTATDDTSYVVTLDAAISGVRTEATCDSAGCVVYTAEVEFNGSTYTDSRTEVLAALGHDWDVPTYTWAIDNSTVTAKRTCKNDATHAETETVNTTAVTKPATCEGKGEITYTASFTNTAFETQTKTVELEAIGHAYGAPAYEWADDYSTVTATVVCAKDASHTITETVNTTYAVVNEPTTETEGLARYTAEFTNELFETQTRDVILPKTEVTGYRIIVTDYTKTAATTSIVADQLYSGEVTFTVDCTRACVVAIVNADGTYTRLTCTTENGEHKFTVAVTDSDVKLVVAILGDVNLDGRISTLDATMAKQKYLGTNFSIDPALQMLTADVNRDNRITTLDGTVIKQVYLGSYTLLW